MKYKVKSNDSTRIIMAISWFQWNICMSSFQDCKIIIALGHFTASIGDYISIWCFKKKNQQHQQKDHQVNINKSWADIVELMTRFLLCHSIFDFNVGKAFLRSMSSVLSIASVLFCVNNINIPIKFAFCNNNRASFEVFYSGLGSRKVISLNEGCLMDIKWFFFFSVGLIVIQKAMSVN